MDRVLKVNLARHIKEPLNEALAKRIGISHGKLKKIADDGWGYITRDSIERTADYLGLEVDQIFELVDLPFWKQTEASKKCVFLRGPGGLATYDNQATSAIQGFLNGRGTNRIHASPVFLNDEAEIVLKAQTENCIVIGSPRSNPATEILLSKVFPDARPAHPPSRKKVPFGFCWSGDSELERTSTLIYAPNRGEARRSGLVIRRQHDNKVLLHAEADFRPEDEYRNWETLEGKDCALVYVQNRPLGTGVDVKLIVLAGFSGIGTVAAAERLIKDFRDLEPLPGKDVVWGIVSAIYAKRKGPGDGREYRESDWVYRTGGRAPIPIGQKRGS